MRILALDLATKTGWAMWDGARMESGVQDFTKRRGESNGMLFLRFNQWLGTITARHLMNFGSCVDLMVFEQAHHRGGAATEIAVGLMTRVLEFGARYGIDHTSVHSLTLKKWATGSGKADKVIMRAAACKFTKPERHIGLMGDDEADAILLLQYALEKFTIPSAAAARCQLEGVSVRET